MGDTIDKRETKEKGRSTYGFLGDSPGRVAVRLVLLSLAVGFLMSFFGVSPLDIVRSAEALFRDIFDNGFEVIERVFGYMVAGAIIVVPIWILMRLMATSRRR